MESAQSIAYAAVDTILVAFHQKKSFEKRLKFRRDFIIYRKKTKKIKIFKI